MTEEFMAAMTASPRKLLALSRELSALAEWLERGMAGRSREQALERGGALWGQLQREAERAERDAEMRDVVNQAMVAGGAAWRTIQQESGQLTLW